MRQALILAGGKGTRLRERLGDLPKPLIDLCGRPLLERQILLLKQHGYQRVLVLVNHRAEAITEFCTANGGWGLEVECIDDGEPRGTAGAVLGVFDRLDEIFLVMYGDTMLQVDLGRFEAFHRRQDGVAATLFLHPNDHPHDSDLVDADDAGFIRGFYPYPHPDGFWLPNLVNAALYVVHRDALLPWVGSEGALDFCKDLFPAMLARGMQLRGYKSAEYIKDVGTPVRIDKVSADFRSGKIARAALDCEQMAVFLDRDGTINREVGHLARAEEFDLLPGVEDAVRRLNLSEYRVCVVTNQPVIARGKCSHEELRRIHNKMETLLGRAGAYVDRIDYCPHHPDSGYPGEVPELKIACDCRKPATGMIDAAVRALNISRPRSWLVGDSSADMLAARRAGLRSIMVESGQAGLDHKYIVAPDYVAADLGAAVDFILKGHASLLQALRPLAASVATGSLVLIGGHSRAGKSTVASALAEVLRESGLICHIISTDRWLRSATNRGSGVDGRHDMAALQQLIVRLNTRPTALSVVLPGYAKGWRVQIPAVETLDIAPSDVVIVEGVVALALAAPGSLRLVVTIDEALRHQRLVREYTLRGEAAQAEALYSSRMRDEWPWIEATSVGALRLEVPAPILSETDR
ncbi:HAD-IIIA family hydrolase [Acidithiobacillus sp. AMEEHan]|uniref:HAD-IIIA family hydrolase n=1 Tax=Acidithiobacillus sp. AMEEHan TaxID=2994951 RepID=UPI0027E49BD3|nr:HAD-IIIA family hydrolase [Acidithiobacillus sp. AMEEHan]